MLRGVDGKREAEKEIRRTRGEKRWRVHLIYVACVTNNRKVKGYSRGIKGGGERQNKEKEAEWKRIKAKDKRRAV